MREEASNRKKAEIVALALIIWFSASLAAASEWRSGPQADAPYARARSSVGFVYVRSLGDARSQPLRPKACAVVVRRDGIVATGLAALCRDDSERLHDEIFFELPEGNRTRSGTARRYRLKPVLLDSRYDLALLRAVPESASEEIDLAPIGLADSARAQLLDDLAIIGSSEKSDSALSIYRGAVEGIDRVENWIKTDARLLRGGIGVAVTSEGKLLGIPAKVIIDSQSIDRDGDGKPDAVRRFGAVAFLRPAHLVASMLNRLGEPAARTIHGPAPGSPASRPAQDSELSPLVMVKGIVRSALDGKPIAGARVGLVAAGSRNITTASLLAWSGTNAEGRFNMNKRVPPGRYTLRAAALGYESFSLDLDINERSPSLVIELRVSR